MDWLNDMQQAPHWAPHTAAVFLKPSATSSLPQWIQEDSDSTAEVMLGPELCNVTCDISAEPTDISAVRER